MGVVVGLPLKSFSIAININKLQARKVSLTFFFRNPSLKLVLDMPNSNHDWNSRYFLFKARTGYVGLMSGIA